MKDKVVKKQIHKYNKKESGKNDTGRPTKYKPEYCQNIIEWFKDKKEKIYYEISYYKVNNDTEKLFYSELGNENRELKGGVKDEKPKIIRQLFPTLQRRASDHNVLTTTLTDSKEGWSQFKEFSEALKMCKDIQESILLESSLSNIFNPTITQLILKNNFGYKDKIENEITGNLTINTILDDIIQ